MQTQSLEMRLDSCCSISLSRTKFLSDTCRRDSSEAQRQESKTGMIKVRPLEAPLYSSFILSSQMLSCEISIRLFRFFISIQEASCDKLSFIMLHENEQQDTAPSSAESWQRTCLLIDFLPLHVMKKLSSAAQRRPC